MQTFLPYPDFFRTALVLDDRRLGKQRVEVYQILRTLQGETSGWRNHPAVKMWRGYEGCLAYYGMTICNEWRWRGFRDRMMSRIAQWAVPIIVIPPWLGDEKFHESHRSNLLRKNSEHYGKFGWTETATLPYVWPV